jgi:hypothetical protein
LNYTGRVRIIDKSEEKDVMRLCRQLHSENGMFQMDDTKVESMLGLAFDRKGGILAGIGEKGKLEGLMYLLLSSFWYTNDNHWEELFLYVSPEHRKSRNAVELLRFAKWCTDQTDYPLFIGILSDLDTDRRESLYDRQLNGGISANNNLLLAKGMLTALDGLKSSSVSNLRKTAEDLRDTSLRNIQQTSSKGRFFVYKKNVA